MSKKLEECSREELIEQIKKLKSRKRFGLVWEDKPEKIVDECRDKLPVLKEVEEKAIGGVQGGPTNIIIEGDNYHALSVLNYTHAGKIDVIYIDPPYNTGNKDFIYNDCYIDKEDTFRHSKWLSFMSKRLELAKNLLADDGVIFISIDDNEQADLRLLCDSIFGEDNYLSTIIWRKNNDEVRKNTSKILVLNEYIICYQKKNLFNGLFVASRIPNDMSNPDNDPRGKWFNANISNPVKNPREKNVYTVTIKGFSITRRWFKDKEIVEKWIDDNKIYLPVKNGVPGTPRLKMFFEDFANKKNVANNFIVDYSTTDGRIDLENVLGVGYFSYPKPIGLIRLLVEYVSNKDATVLDFFAGSGTTGQAVMELNKEDGGHRQFILVTNNEANGKADAGAEGIAEKVTYPRIKTVITGIRPDGSKYSDGVPANLRYFKTDFVEKGKTTDDTREALITECSDMIRMRENVFEFVASTPEYRFYKNDKIFVPIIFDQFAIAETWAKVEELNTEKLPVHCYNFSYNRHANEEEIPDDTKLEWTACSIPESVLEVYKKIFRKREV